ncbi:MAG: hypothetical protein WCS73_11685 [Lentisphaeria bacterium]
MTTKTYPETVTKNPMCVGFRVLYACKEEPSPARLEELGKEGIECVAVDEVLKAARLEDVSEKAKQLVLLMIKHECGIVMGKDLVCFRAMYDFLHVELSKGEGKSMGVMRKLFWHVREAVKDAGGVLDDWEFIPKSAIFSKDEIVK